MAELIKNFPRTRKKKDLYWAYNFETKLKFLRIFRKFPSSGRHQFPNRIKASSPGKEKPQSKTGLHLDT